MQDITRSSPVPNSIKNYTTSSITHATAQICGVSSNGLDSKKSYVG